MSKKRTTEGGSLRDRTAEQLNHHINIKGGVFWSWVLGFVPQPNLRGYQYISGNS